ncbi:unnamed protein product [Gongylonema pulchrum]|uniref:Late endosomal/lysosomal adaptor and MAPK and MTOR activator 5 n=1 Tax=Gongylonema pulchrum TaxID=637853 RepID=A0A183D1D5_9BILA|nr:unnamed protein product [Gongylonema pulchrum]
MEAASQNKTANEVLTAKEAVQILHCAADVLKQEPALVITKPLREGKIILVGSLYGNIVGNANVSYAGRNCNTRSQCCTVLLLLIMRIHWPEDIIILRGSQETAVIGKHNGFLEQVC